MENCMWSRESSQDVQVVDLKISVRQQTLLKEETSEPDEFTFSVYPASTSDLYGTGEKRSGSQI